MINFTCIIELFNKLLNIDFSNIHVPFKIRFHIMSITREYFTKANYINVLQHKYFNILNVHNS